MRNKIAIVTKELFQVSLITYLVLLIVETIKVNFVSFFFNLNILLGLVLVSGIVMVLAEVEFENWRVFRKMTMNVDWDFLFSSLPTLDRKETLRKLTSHELNYTFVVSLLGAGVVYYKIQNLGTIAFFIALTIFIVIFLI